MARDLQIVIVVPNGKVVVTSVTGTYQIFEAAIQISDRAAKVTLAGSRRKSTYANGLFEIHSEVPWKSIERADLVIIPAISEHLEEALQQNQQLLPWLVRQYEEGATLASLCTGSFFLAEAGLLHQKRCTTHWSFATQFQNRYPGCIFSKNSIITEQDRIYTSGGAFSFLNLIVYLVRLYFGKSIAREMINIFQVDQYRKSQEPFIKFETQKEHQDQIILKIQEFVEQAYARHLSNEELARLGQLSVRSMMRRFKMATGNTPIEYLQRVRIEHAKTLLIETNLMISEIQHKVGYTDPKSFREIFSRYTGTLPKTYRKKYALIGK